VSHLASQYAIDQASVAVTITQATTDSAITATIVPVALPRPSHGCRIEFVTRVSGRTSATCRSAEPITSGGGPPAPSRNDGKNSSSPTACAERAEGSTEPSRTPTLTNPTAPDTNPTTTRHHWSTLNGWTVHLTLASGQTISSLWNGVNTGTSGAVTVKNAAYNGTIAAGASTSFGYTGTGNGSLAPTDVSCTSP
jgi:hypothetical protein